MSKPKLVPTTVRPTLAELLPIYQELFPRRIIKQFVKEAQVQLYWRLLTPLVIVWGLVFQRLQPDHTCDAAVSYFHSGAVDHLDRSRRHTLPLSKRLTSESTSAYVQGRNRLPLAVLQSALRYVCQTLTRWVQDEKTLQWHGHAVRVLDGTTFRLAPQGDLASTYGQAQNQLGTSYWVLVKSLVAFCLKSQAVVGYTEAAGATSETALIRPVIEQDPLPHSIYLADRGLGVYRLVQITHPLGHYVVARLNFRVAKRLLQTTGRRRLSSGTECRVAWSPERKNKVEADWPCPPIEGRLIYVRLQRNGFRPMDLYLFTTLLDETCYLLNEIVVLYGLRWQGELDYRHIKTTLEMDEFNVQSAAMFRKELAAGLLTYNLICAYMVKAAEKAGIAPTALSFSRCARRLRDMLLQGVPAWVEPDHLEEYILERLAKCTLPKQPTKVKHEPRRVRRRPAIFPALKGDRDTARRQSSRMSKTKVS